jgi:hypothetical protein
VGTIQQLNLVTSELREGVMKTRMQPISRLFDKVPRVVRDVSVACGKQVRIETEGKDTELDRTLLEAINDPLTHLVRNAIDHGIEQPDRRLEAGKPAEGLLVRWFGDARSGSSRWACGSDPASLGDCKGDRSSRRFRPCTGGAGSFTASVICRPKGPPK